jgi:outer membrane receptor for ferrienterochelin and colicin
MDEKFSGMKYIFLPILLLFTFPLRVNGDNFKREIITAEMIRSSGLIRIGDILLLADGLNANSMDGYTWRVSMSGLSSFQRQNWTVMLDGQRIELSSSEYAINSN